MKLSDFVVWCFHCYVISELHTGGFPTNLLSVHINSDELHPRRTLQCHLHSLTLRERKSTHRYKTLPFPVMTATLISSGTSGQRYVNSGGNDSGQRSDRKSENKPDSCSVAENSNTLLSSRWSNVAHLMKLRPV